MRRSGSTVSSVVTLLLVAFLAVGGVACAGDGAKPDAKPAAGVSAVITRSEPARAPSRVVLISVAGLQPSDYGAGSGIVRSIGAPMPNLATLAARGAYANAMTPVLPAAPYPVHATLATGLLPVRHRVLGDEVMGPQGLHVRGIAREGRIQGTPIWDIAEANGIPATALNWPLTRGADVRLLLPDMGVPDRDPEARWFELLSGEASPWVLDRLARMDPTLAQIPWPSALLRDELIAKLACEIARQPVTPGLWLLAFENSGTAIARDGPDSDGKRIALSQVDQAIGRMVDCFAAQGILDTTTFIVVGDRALFPIHSVVYPNVALERVGLITQAPMHLGAGIGSWDAYVRSYGGAGVVYADSEDSAILARQALEEEAERTRAFRVVPASELLRLDADPEAWFGLEGGSGYGIGKTARGLIVQATPRKGLGGYLPTRPGSDVGFVAWGAGVRPGVRVQRMSQVDVAPTVATLLGLTLPGPDGSPLVAILGAWQAARETTEGAKGGPE